MPPRNNRTQLGDEAMSYVLDQITSGALAPGDRVRPETVAFELGISSTPAREALQALRAEGFLDLAPRRGFTVARLTGDDIRDIYLVQSMVAGECAARAVRAATPELISRLEEIHSSLSTASERGNEDDMQMWNHLFHREINLAADSPKMAWIIQALSRYAPSRFYSNIQGWPKTTLDVHRMLLDAFRRGDVEAGRELMSAHVTEAGELLAQHIDSRAARFKGNRAVASL